MPRKARFIIANNPIHINQRGNNRQNIFHSEEDKAFYIKSFMEYKKKYRVKVYAWALMDNHVHFILEPKSICSLGKLFHDLNTKYVMYYNSVYSKSGRLFGNRFFSSILDEEHLFEAIRYVELNPFSAKMERNIASYPWTSARFNIPDWLEYLKTSTSDDSTDKLTAWTTIKRHTQRGIPSAELNFINAIAEKFNRTFNLNFRKSKSWLT
jgi:putative transposase